MVNELYLQCQTAECGHTWVAHLSAVRTLSPSANPREGVHLPLAPRPDFKKRRPAADNDNQDPTPAIASG